MPIRSRLQLAAVLLAGLWLSVANSQTAAPPPAYKAISLAGFSDSINHWRNRYGSDYARYRNEQIIEIADNLLLYQRDNGGWVENRDPTRILNDEERQEITAEKANPTGSFDNRNVYTQIEYLSAVFEQTGRPEYRAAALRGLEYTFVMQHQHCGGWPHTVPGSEAYHAYITMADEVTSGVLRTLRKLASGSPPFTYTDAALRERARAAVERGDACILQLQVLQNGQPTGWAGQYHPDTLQVAQGRSFELPSIVSQESVEMLRYLMSIPEPSPAVIRAIEAAADWLERVMIRGWRIETVQLAEPVRYEYHTATTDRRLVADPNATLWARFYDLADNSAVLANRDSKRVKDYADIHHERRTGYAWYGQWPARLLASEYPAWRKRLGRETPAAKPGP